MSRIGYNSEYDYEAIIIIDVYDACECIDDYTPKKTNNGTSQT